MPGETTAFANARIFDGTSAELREGCVRVAAGTIAEVAEGPGPGDRIVDCRGRTVVPGLIDAHFHAYGARLSLLEIETSPLSYLALAGAKRLAGALGRGFTTVRDPGGGDAGLARAIREGLTAAPRYLFCGPALSQTGGHGDPRPPELGCCLGGGHMAEVVDGVDALRRAARERLRSGAHAIKVMASGWSPTTRWSAGAPNSAWLRWPRPRTARSSTRDGRRSGWPGRRGSGSGSGPT